ncbi:MAG: prepilin-type N-terminal cleavage/methylation domain-containing protein [Candidatus Saccharibacteria bacterium]|nr:prepilin-type N-terminal cleavage/methylation domain-containing protein [Candidatus Saccharibacteria bacterium]
MIKEFVKTKHNKRGFTIVELLVVIVVIGLLAAISVVSYTGITAKANTASSQHAVNSVNKKINVYASEASTTGKYPVTLATLFVPAATYNLNGVTYDAMGTTTSTVLPITGSAPASKSSVLYVICGVRTLGNNAAPAAAADITNITGSKIYAFDWANTQISTSPTINGNVSVNVGSQNIGCFPAGA